ncbi:MAG: hypothetical protein LBG70_00110 [Bifidobacteriaceae bacterium]|jgi:hypothetical protein|nr:hypothetical protein [Bifidobacteriaceae bacterium]
MLQITGAAKRLGIVSLASTLVLVLTITSLAATEPALAANQLPIHQTTTDLSPKPTCAPGGSLMEYELRIIDEQSPEVYVHYYQCKYPRNNLPPQHGCDLQDPNLQGFWERWDIVTGQYTSQCDQVFALPAKPSKTKIAAKVSRSGKMVVSVTPTDNKPLSHLKGMKVTAKAAGKTLRGTLNRAGKATFKLSPKVKLGPK